MVARTAPGNLTPGLALRVPFTDKFVFLGVTSFSRPPRKAIHDIGMVSADHTCLKCFRPRVETPEQVEFPFPEVAFLPGGWCSGRGELIFGTFRSPPRVVDPVPIALRFSFPLS